MTREREKMAFIKQNFLKLLLLFLFVFVSSTTYKVSSRLYNSTLELGKEEFYSLEIPYDIAEEYAKLRLLIFLDVSTQKVVPINWLVKKVTQSRVEGHRNNLESKIPKNSLLSVYVMYLTDILPIKLSDSSEYHTNHILVDQALRRLSTSKAFSEHFNIAIRPALTARLVGMLHNLNFKDLDSAQKFISTINSSNPEQVYKKTLGNYIPGLDEAFKVLNIEHPQSRTYLGLEYDKYLLAGYTGAYLISISEVWKQVNPATYQAYFCSKKLQNLLAESKEANLKTINLFKTKSFMDSNQYQSFYSQINSYQNIFINYETECP